MSIHGTSNKNVVSKTAFPWIENDSARLSEDDAKEEAWTRKNVLIPLISVFHLNFISQRDFLAIGNFNSFWGMRQKIRIRNHGFR